jgi:hypothetical protein
MMYFANLSLGVTSDERCAHFRRHGIHFEFNADPIDADNADDDDNDDFDDAIMERLTQANMRMHAHFDTL